MRENGTRRRTECVTQCTCKAGGSDIAGFCQRFVMFENAQRVKDCTDNCGSRWTIGMAPSMRKNIPQ